MKSNFCFSQFRSFHPRSDFHSTSSLTTTEDRRWLQLGWNWDHRSSSLWLSCFPSNALSRMNPRGKRPQLSHSSIDAIPKSVDLDWHLPPGCQPNDHDYGVCCVGLEWSDWKMYQNSLKCWPINLVEVQNFFKILMETELTNLIIGKKYLNKEDNNSTP